MNVFSFVLTSDLLFSSYKISAFLTNIKKMDQKK